MKMNKYVVLLILAVLVSSISQIILKKSASKTYDSVLKEYLNVDKSKKNRNVESMESKIKTENKIEKENEKVGYPARGSPDRGEISP